MPDRDLFEPCGGRVWASAYGSLYRDTSDPNLVQKFVAALEPELQEIALPLKQLALWVSSARAPRDLFQPRCDNPPLDDIPIELREGMEVAVQRAVTKCLSQNTSPTMQQALAVILSCLAERFATKLCAIEVAKSEFGLSTEDIMCRSQELEAKMVEAPETKELANRLLHLAPAQSLHSRPRLRRRREKTSDLMHISIAR